MKLVKKTAISIAGIVIILGGLLMLILPGPGLLTIFLGLGILASEYHWADRILNFIIKSLRLPIDRSR